MVMEVAHTVIGGKQREVTERKRWREIYIERQRDKRGRWREKIRIHRDKNKEKDRKGEARARRGGRGVNSIGAEDRPEVGARANLDWQLDCIWNQLRATSLAYEEGHFQAGLAEWVG